MQSLNGALGKSAYPGRGILMGLDEGGGQAVCAYFIMGRSDNSRNRVFVPDGDGLRTQAHDASRMTDSSLVIYAPVRVLNGQTIVTNGDQTDTIYDALAQGGTFEAALRTRVYEPDAPNYTPRISGILRADGGYALSILKRAREGADACARYFYEYEPVAGMGHLIHTYAGDGNPLPSFAGEPVAVALPGAADVDALAETIWNALDKDNRISLFVRTIALWGEGTRTRIINKLA